MRARASSYRCTSRTHKKRGGGTKKKKKKKKKIVVGVVGVVLVAIIVIKAAVRVTIDALLLKSGRLKRSWNGAKRTL